ARSARWVKVRDERLVECVPPLDVVNDIMNLSDPPFPRLEAVTRTPVFAPSGQINLSTGYDPLTRLYCDIGDLKFPPGPAAPGAEEVSAARRTLLEDLLGDFPQITQGLLDLKRLSGNLRKFRTGRCKQTGPSKRLGVLAPRTCPGGSYPSSRRSSR